MTPRDVWLNSIKLLVGSTPVLQKVKDWRQLLTPEGRMFILKVHKLGLEEKVIASHNIYPNLLFLCVDMLCTAIDISSPLDTADILRIAGVHEWLEKL